MKKIVYAFVSIILFSLATQVGAQGYPSYGYMGEPTILCNGHRVPQSVGCGYNGGYGNNGVSIPYGVGAGVPFNTMVNGRPMRCSWADRGISGLAGAGIGNAIAYMVNRFTHKDTIDRTGASVAGGLAGATIMCSPTAYDDGEFAASRVTGAVGGYSQQGGVTSTKPSICMIEGRGKPIEGISDDECDTLRKGGSTSFGAKKVSASVVREVVPASRPAVDGADLWKWRSGKATPENPSLCVVEKITGEAKPPFCSEMKELPRNEGESRQEWAMRAEKA